MSYQEGIAKRLLPLTCTTKTNSIVSIFDVLVKVTMDKPDFDEEAITALIERAPYGPWHPRVSAIHGQVINVHLTTLPPADAAPVPVVPRAPLCLTA